MPTTQHKTEQRNTETKVGEIAEQLEHVFLAGLGALSNAQKAGAKTFDALVKQGEDFRDETSKKTESLIDDVQDAIRGMTSDAQSKATGLLDQVRDVSKLDKMHDVFDSRVQGALDRLNVPSKKDIDSINRKLNKILKELDGKGATTAKKPRATAKRKTAKKSAKVAKATPRKTNGKTAAVEADKVTAKVASKE
jgi:poly(hydroxyalkanoate) granule-associated protein